MLDAAVVSFLSSLSDERAFDEPLRAILRARGFYDISLLHGPSELGRDFVAKHDGPGGTRQYALQSKTGDINLKAFREIRNQLEDIRTITFQDANFDSDLPRVAVLVTTGALRGGARQAAAGYREGIAKDHPNRSVEYWEQGRLVEYIVSSPDAALTGRDLGPLQRLLGLIDAAECDERELERFSRRWIPAEGQHVPPAAVIEAAMIASALAGADRLDLACGLCLDLLRAGVVGAHGQPLTDLSWTSAQQAGDLFAMYAGQLWTRCRHDEPSLDPYALANQGGPGTFVTYPVRCLRIIELLGLLALRRREQGQDASDIAAYLAAFIQAHPGAAHPVSDRYAVSLIPAACLLGRDRPDVVEPWLRAAAIWVCDHYDDGLGLGGAEAAPRDELSYLLAAFEHIAPPAHSTSYLSTVILDLICVLELAGIYSAAAYDFSVHAPAELLHLPSTRAQYVYDGDEIQQEAGIGYNEAWEPTDGWKSADHHGDVDPSWLEANGRRWEKLALSSVTRDRHDIGLIRRLVEDASADPGIDESPVDPS